MVQCDTCGNDYDKPIKIEVGGRSHNFDSFECAIHKLAPTCDQCGCRILGHGMEQGGRFFCCANCAERAGVPEMQDRT